jgi:hypothetical protein
MACFKFALACEKKNLKHMTEGLKLNSLYQLFVHAGDVNTMDSTLQRPIQTYALDSAATRAGCLQKKT